MGLVSRHELSRTRLRTQLASPVRAAGDSCSRAGTIEYGTNNGDIDILHWDGDQMLAATDFITDAPLWDAVFSPTHQDKLLEFYDYTTQQRHLPLTDHRNSVVGAWNATLGQMGELARYDAEGLLTRLSSAEEIECDEHDTAVCAPPNDIPFAFNSLFRSPTTGLVYMRNRWYAPRFGQFISHDPLEYVDASNLYAFASFDPINNWDPFGLDDENLTPDPPNPCEEHPGLCESLNYTPAGLEHLDPTAISDRTTDNCAAYESCDPSLTPENSRKTRQQRGFDVDRPYPDAGFVESSPLQLDDLVSLPKLVVVGVGTLAVGVVTKQIAKRAAS